jgi:hypothetical protein
VNKTHIEGLTTIASNFGPKETMDRLGTEIRTKGMEVFARVDHAVGAADVGLNLRPTELIIFGNARGGTPLMQSAQTIGIPPGVEAFRKDLPNAKVQFLDTGHFAIGTHVVEIAAAIKEFFDENSITS